MAPLYPFGEDLRRFRFHTGAELRPLGEDEPFPVLFRDLGPVALARHLRGTLPRLAGPLTPLLYARTIGFREPYTDHAALGRLVFLRPREAGFWFSGIEGVFVARATRPVDLGGVGYVPGAVPLEAIERQARQMSHAGELRESLGGAAYDDQVASELEGLDRLNVELERTERVLGPLRAALQGRDPGAREAAWSALARTGLGEEDLCAAWHHLPAQRRAAVVEMLPLLASGPWAGRAP